MNGDTSESEERDGGRRMDDKVYPVCSSLPFCFSFSFVSRLVVTFGPKTEI